MTEKLYYKSAYIKSFDACVLLSQKRDDGSYITVLDKTAFFPEEGGQYSDSGEISGDKVIKVYEESGIIYHVTEREHKVGECVFCSIDFDERYEKMQSHTAEHILSGIIHSLYGLNNVGFHLGADEVTMDIDAPLSAEELARVELLANEAVYKNVEVESLFPSAQEAKNIEYRSKLDITEGLRIIRIGDVDSCACCAPHVARTGEIGAIKILDFAGLRGGIRIRIAAGRRAQRIFVKMQENLAKISALLSVPKLECGVAVEKLLSDYSAIKGEFSSFKLGYYKKLGESAESASAALYSFDGADYDELRAFLNAAASRFGMLILLSVCEQNVKYIIYSSNTPMNTEIKKINAALCGKGGGKSDMVQGSFSLDIESIEDYFLKEYGARISPRT
ncbi:MAG: hypothetical protein J6Q68_01575 [Clostridia bacterium]|nr:hypothetical protein [Clostridia bacterium]